MRRSPFSFADQYVLPGHSKRIEIPVARDALGAQFGLQVVVIHGRHPGPTMWVNAGLHGDEIAGIHIAGRLLTRVNPRTLRGTLLVVPVVNVFGVMNQTRYLPDRRDLNRSFPGSQRGSLAARIAHLFLQLVVQPCDYGVDLHTAGSGRRNLPQVRVSFAREEAVEIARAFGPEVILDSQMRDGSLRAAATQMGKLVLVYEAGETLRAEEEVVGRGLDGIRRVMHRLGMVDEAPPPPEKEALLCQTSQWVRAGRSGLANYMAELGDTVEKGQVLAVITDAFQTARVRVRAPDDGVVIGRATGGLVTRGDALYHLART